MRNEHIMMTASEDDFWEDGGLYEQMGDRVTAYICEHRQVDANLEIPVGASWKEIEEAYAHKPGQYRNYVSYSAYHSTDDDVYVDNLDEVAVEGRVQFVEEVDEPSEVTGMVMGNVPYDTRKNYISPVMENPTWLEVALLANDMINCTGDNHHIFLEAIRPSESKFTLDEKSFVKVYKFCMGS